MRILIKIVAIIGLIGTTISCKDYLKVESPSTFTEANAFSNLDFASKELNGVYNSIASMNLYGYGHIFTSCDNDIEFVNWTNDGGVNQVAHYAGTDGIAFLQSVWNTYYQAIERANLSIDNLPKSTIWVGEYASQAQSLYGQAITLRALCYFDLIQYFGDVPFKVRSTEAGDVFNLPKTDRDSIYEYIVKDLADAEHYVPWISETHTAEVISKGFVKGLRARIALAYAGYSLRNKTFEMRRGKNWQQYYKIANQECKEIMESGQHQFTPVFADIFKTLGAYAQNSAKENLFEVAFGRLYSGRYAYTIGMTFSANPNDPKYGRGPNIISTSPYYYYSFDPKDTRRNVSCELYNYGNNQTLSKQTLSNGVINTFGLTKWRKSWINPLMGGNNAGVNMTGVNFPVMRYADVVLMFAETENEINGSPTAAAKDALAMVRNRAFPQAFQASKVKTYIDSVAVSKDAFFNAIVNERAWELGGELIRKYDLVRWNLLGAKLQAMKEGNLQIANNDPKYSNVPTSIFWKYNSDGETIDILNPDYRLPDTAIPGYARSSWIVNNYNVNKANTTILGYVANGYIPAKNNYLYPIHKDIITSSNGVLSNDQMP